MLDYDKIASSVDSLRIFDYINVLEVTTSTNDYLKELDSGNYKAIVFAKEQTKARGRRGRTWISDFGGCLMFSFKLTPKLSLSNISFLTQLCAVSLHKTMLELIGDNVDLKIKWPNDLMLNSKKICGVLCESEIATDVEPSVIIGIGLNVFGEIDDERISDIASTIESELSIKIDVAKFMYSFIEDFFNRLTTLENTGKINQADIDYINQNFYNKGKFITGTAFTGKLLEVDSEGALLLEKEDGSVHRHMFGDVFA